MKRRRFFQSVAVLPALQGVPLAAQYASSTAASNEIPKLAETSPEAVANSVRRFFTTEQFQALQKLAGLIVPKFEDRPGALEAGVPEFLDFLLKSSGPERQALYRNGLDRLNTEAQKRYKKFFAQISADEAKPVLDPLTKPWSWQPPADPFARFLREAKDDLLQATNSSRELSAALSRRSRAAGGTNAYWLPLD
jgi:hypothetical protein